MAKTSSQLDAEIAEALTRPLTTSTSAKKLDARQLDLIAQAASFGSVNVDDLVPQPRTVATIRPERLKRTRRAAKRLRELAEAGMLVEVYGDKYELTDAGRAALETAGFVKQSTGYWIKPGVKRPGWAA